ncbi:kinesin-like protein KIF18A [Dendronephthya gigantea]|uniref:kinesin-like protein KIF18A n=1 Tax=Dendronephthya gigantea TaxID=151771 RepID=UPI00106D48A7|nr:kinesin-like protein KIF18A [Dendronephthya gigantea]
MVYKGAKSKTEQSSSVKVVVRVRPLNSAECLKNNKNVVRPMDERVIVFDPVDDFDANSFIPSKRSRRRSNILDRRVKDLRFIFDRVFDENATNEDIFQHTTRSIVDGVLQGYNCTVFAYGATGAGKTHTMLGNDKTPGVMLLTMIDLYKRIEEMKHEKTCEVAVSYLEVYNENIRDLLMPGKELAMREDPQRGVCVKNLTLHQPKSAEELFGMLEYGNNNRSQHPTDANATSSRSHAVFQVYIRQKNAASGLKTDVQIAKMSLIDLAGSERATVTKNRGPRMREGANINKSLLALGNCINALAENKKNVHIPYRNSKLTRILKDSLGGNCRTVMIAAVSPSSLSYEDTYNTLKYADRAKNIKSNIIKNVVSVDVHVSQYAKLVSELQGEVGRLKERLNKFETGEATPMNRKVEARKKVEVERIKSEIKSVYNQKSDIKKNIRDVECLEREMMEKLHRKQRNAEWMNILSHDDSKTNKVETRVRKCLSATKSRLKHLKERRDKLNEQAKENEDWLRRTEEEINLIDAPVDDSFNSRTFLNVYETSCANELIAKELKQECKYYKKCLQNHESQRKREKRLIDSLLKFVRKQHGILKSSGMNTNETNEEYENIVTIVEDNREVAWADQSVVVAEKEPEPLDVIKNAENKLKNGFDTPHGTPSRSKIIDTSFDRTPRRVVKTPTLILSSTLPSPVDNKTSTTKVAPGTYNINSGRTAVSQAKSPCPVRLNLLSALNQDGSSGNGNSTNIELIMPSSTSAGLASDSDPKQTVENTSSVLNDASLLAPKTAFDKRLQGKPPAVKKRCIGPPLRAQSNTTNIDTSNSRKRANLTSGGENGKRIPGYASLTKSAAQKITAIDMLPKRCHSKENELPQAKRRKIPRSASSCSSLSDQLSRKRGQYKNHVNGLKRAVSVMNMRK